MKTLTINDTPTLGEPFIDAADGKVYVAITAVRGCESCIFEGKQGCGYSPNCITSDRFMIFKEYK